MDDAGQKNAANPDTRHAAQHTDAKMPALSARRDHAKHITPAIASANPIADSHMHSEWQ